MRYIYLRFTYLLLLTYLLTYLSWRRKLQISNIKPKIHGRFPKARGGVIGLHII